MIIDCFTFCDELDLLELRLHTLADVVDQFALVEADSTFQRTPKPLHYAEHRDDPRFAPFRDRITHVIVDDLPVGTAWGREHFQRNAIRRGLYDCQNDDLILVSDVDEIPNPEAVAGLSYPPTLYRDHTSIAFKQRLYAYTLNWRHARPWYGTRAVLYCTLGEPQALRQTQGPRYPGEPIIEDGGWSFSSFGGVSAVQAKLQSFSHTTCNRPEYLDAAYIQACIDNGRSILPNDGNDYVWQDVDDTYPPYLLANLDRFQHWLSDAAMVKGWAY